MQGTISLFSLFSMGGPVMWPLLVLLVFATAIIIERIVYFIRYDMHPQRGAQRAVEIARTQGKEAAQHFCTQIRSPWGTTLNSALSGEMGLAVVQAKESVEQMDRPISYLDLIANISPIVGFLGTVTGMIAAFKSIASANTVQLQLVASGLYEALFTTAFGLIIAIVAAIAAHILRQVIDSYDVNLSTAMATVGEETTHP